MSLYFLKSGILTTIQDLGRTGFRRFGINPSGAMDWMACRLANIILGNDETEPVLEIHFPAPILKFEKMTNFAICGADFSAQLNDRKVETFRPAFAKEGDILSFTEPLLGARVYLAVAGGFQTEKWLGSASANLKIGFGHNLQKGERICFKQKTSQNSKNDCKVGFSLIPRYSHFPTVRVIPGAEFDKLTAISVETFLKNSFKISATSDRMGFRLEGDPLFLLDEVEMVSSAVDFGTIQLLPNGQMVILMADHQTTGGYPRIAHIAKIDLPIVAQLKPGDKIYFRMISEEEAERLFLIQDKNLNLLKWAVKFKNEIIH
mgnify:CR=1 FL=1